MSYQHKVSPYPLSCLLDSGSDINLLPAYFAQNIGIIIEKGEKRNIQGIGNMEITAYRHKVKLYLDQTSFETIIDFSYDQQFPLLGRIGFFDHFDQIVFKEKEKLVELY